MSVRQTKMNKRSNTKNQQAMEEWEKTSEKNEEKLKNATQQKKCSSVVYAQKRAKMQKAQLSTLQKKM